MQKKPLWACTIEAPCKINLHLGIGEKRADGFHSLESLFAALAFGDTLSFECTGKEGECSLSMNQETPVEAIPPEKNHVSRAVSLFREKTGYSAGLRIHLDKRIPAGAGLGGGSSDAASTLLALNSLTGEALSAGELLELAALLGSDVPFFISAGAAFVSGRGEVVEQVNLSQKLWALLVKPPFSSDTSLAYSLLDKAREGGLCGKIGESLPKTKLIGALNEDPGIWPFYNDFLPVFLNSTVQANKENEDAAQIYRAILDALRKKGSLFAGLSGSGSCCYGIFTAKEAAEKAEKEVLSEISASPFYIKRSGHPKTFFIKLTFFLAQSAIPVLKYY